MKRMLCAMLLLLLLTTTARAVDIDNYQISDWAQEDAIKALDLGITQWNNYGDLRLPITRGDFAEKAASLVAIEIIDQNLVRRTYTPVILVSSNTFRGQGQAFPENAFLSQDGTRLFYTATVEEDTYHYDVPVDGSKEQAPVLLFLKGVYTVTMDLKTGEQTWTRADLPES